LQYNIQNTMIKHKIKFEVDGYDLVIVSKKHTG